MVPINNLCCILDWDSTFFGHRIAHVTVNRLNAGDMGRVMKWCRNRAICCLYFLVNADHLETVRLAEENGFRLVDIRVTLEKKLQEVATMETSRSAAVRLSKPEDIPALRAIARRCHHDSRFYHDSNFPKYLCDSLYETWIERSCEGYADAVLVADLTSQPVGYVSCHLLGEQKGKIGLVGVDAHSEGKGLGQALIGESLTWFSQHGVTEVTIVTQGRNYRAQRLYQQSGFLTKSMQLWYHRWFEPTKDLGSE